MSEETMQNYLIEPKAPLIIRSGRPFDGQRGADEARFPPPSTLAGALRTAHAESNGKELGPDLANISVSGPLPVKFDDTSGCISLLVPKPADALYFWNADRSAPILVRAAPKMLAAGEGCDLPNGMLPLQLTEDVVGKPASGPRWWSWEDLIAYRRHIAETTIAPISPTMEDIRQHGWTPPDDDVRTHVAIERVTQASETGKLYQTAGLSFLPRPEGKTTFGQDCFPLGRIGLLGRIAGGIDEGVITLGGERRLSAISVADNALWPTMPATLVQDIRTAGGLCLTLLTPALFAAGWRPGWLQEIGGMLQGSPEKDGPQLMLRVAALERWQPHSGWDLAARQPRAGRKLIPAGAVYWFEILDASDEALRSLWLTSICDDRQDQRDGFGLALPQAWTPPSTN